MADCFLTVAERSDPTGPNSAVLRRRTSFSQPSLGKGLQCHLRESFDFQKIFPSRLFFASLRLCVRFFCFYFGFTTASFTAFRREQRGIYNRRVSESVE